MGRCGGEAQVVEDLPDDGRAPVCPATERGTGRLDHGDDFHRSAHWGQSKRSASEPCVIRRGPSVLQAWRDRGRWQLDSFCHHCSIPERNPASLSGGRGGDYPPSHLPGRVGG